MINNISIDERVLNDIIFFRLSFEEIDNIFKQKLPKDITKLIFIFTKDICDNCYNCCELCRLYCFIQPCLRTQEINVCCNTELINELKNYEDRENYQTPPPPTLFRQITDLENENEPLLNDEQA